MPNSEHVRVLGQGVQQWNEWRLTSTDAPDLTYLDLSSRNLSEVNLAGAG